MIQTTMYIYHHLGLGDHVSCHGIVRHFCEIEESVGLFVKQHNYENVKYMFNDLTNLELIPLYDDNDVNDFININKLKNILRVGNCVGGDSSKCKWQNFEEDFYLMAGLPVEYKTKKFFINRNLEKEIKLFNSLNLKKNEYIFVHDGDNSPNTVLKNIPEGIKIIKPTSHGLFDWMYTIENAKEIHCLDSSFICLVDCMKLDDKKLLFNHRYVKNYPKNIKLFSNKNWVIYET